MEHETSPTPAAETATETGVVDVQIVGAGLAGLLAANLAADAGHTVRLIERTNRPGGRAASVDHHGYTLNVGPHAVYLDGELRRTLNDLGLDPSGAAPDTTGGTGSIGDRVGLLPAGPGSLLRTGLFGLGAKLELGRFMARLPGLDPADGATLTTGDWLAGLTDRPELRAFIQGIVNLTTYNPAADRASADAAIGQLQMALGTGVRYVDGGWGSMVDWLSARADRLGVDRVTAAVTEIRTEPGGPGPAADSVAGGIADTGTRTDAGTGTMLGPVVAVTAEGDRLAARTCILAAGGPALADRLLGLDGVLAGRAGPPVEVSALDLGLRRRPPVGAHLALDRRLYATVHSEAAGLTPDGRHLVTVARYRLPGEDAGPDETRATLRAHAAAMGIAEDDIEMERYLHRLVVATGMPLAERGGMVGRPGSVVAERPGVFVAGDWVGPRGLLADASAASAGDAVAAAGAALGAVPSTDRGRRARLVGS